MARSIANSPLRPHRATVPGASLIRDAGAAVETAAADQWKWLDDWIAEALTRHADTERASNGGQKAVRRAALTRDAMLRELADKYYPGLRRTAQARTIHQLTKLYATRSWRRDRGLMAPPPHYADSPHELLWRAFASGAHLPLSERRLCSILRPPAQQARSRADARAASAMPTLVAAI